MIGPRHPHKKGKYVVTDSDKTRWHYLSGKVHRDNDKPAVISRDKATMCWFQNDVIHRDNDLPAMVESNGYKEWYQKGKLHRDQGPAIVSPDGYKEYYYNGIKCSKETNQWLTILNNIKEKQTC